MSGFGRKSWKRQLYLYNSIGNVGDDVIVFFFFFSFGKRKGKAFSGVGQGVAS